MADDSGYTYTGSGGPMQNKRQYEWNHAIGETVSALVRHGLRRVARRARLDRVASLPLACRDRRRHLEHTCRSAESAAEL